MFLQLVVGTPLGLTANHTSADGLKAENITLTFSSTVMSTGCRVTVNPTNLTLSGLRVLGGMVEHSSSLRDVVSVFYLLNRKK